MNTINGAALIFVLVIYASFYTVCASCGVNTLQSSSAVDILDQQIPGPSSDHGESECVWLVTGPNTTRIELNVTTLSAKKKHFVFIGNGHNSSNDDSIITKVAGANTTLTIVSSGKQIWVKYEPEYGLNSAGTRMFIIKLDLYQGTECLAGCQCLMTNSELEVQCVLGWTVDIIDKLPVRVSDLTLSEGSVTSLRQRAFSRLQTLLTLTLLDNGITVIGNNTFDGLPHLLVLNLSSNAIYDLDIGAFNGLQQLTLLDLRVNKLTEILPDRYKPLRGLQKLYLHNNNIRALPIGFCELFQLQYPGALRLDGNNLADILPGTFRGCDYLFSIKLSRNRITNLRNGSFQGLKNLLSLELSKNIIETVDQGAFTDLSTLLILRLKTNQIVNLGSHAFVGLTNLNLLDLRYNPWMRIEPYAFWGMPNLTFLFLERADIDQNKGTIDLKSLNGLSSLHDMFVDDHRLCCIKPDACSPQTAKPLFHTCKRLMPNDALRALLWVLGISSLAGNMYVIVLRCQEKNVRNQTQAILILNLAISDLLMGFYMLIIASADVHFGQEFFLLAEIWKSSGVCMFAGLVSLFSSEASVLFVVLISLDRLLCVALPFGKKRMTAYIAKVSCMLVWVSVSIIGVTAVILQVATTDVYDLATVCVGIPIVSTKQIRTRNVDTDEGYRKIVTETTGTASTWQFSIAIYLGLNLLAFVVVLICYIAIGAIVAVKLPSKQLQRKKDRSREIKMAGRMALIVFTDFCCWMPVIVLGILIQSGSVEAVPIETYAWLVALVLPLNSALNPYIYTISTEITKVKRRRCEKKEEFNMRKTAMNSQTMPSQSRASRFTNL